MSLAWTKMSASLISQIPSFILFGIALNVFPFTGFAIFALVLSTKNSVLTIPGALIGCLGFDTEEFRAGWAAIHPVCCRHPTHKIRAAFQCDRHLVGAGREDQGLVGWKCFGRDVE